MKTKYVTTAIPYTNDRPHIGHAMDYLLADVWSRYQKQSGFDVRFSAGLDEHGTKIANKAKESGISPQEFVDKLTPVFKDFLAQMNISCTDFIRTTDVDHVHRVQEIWRRLDEAGVIYKDKYIGWYCVGCEAFVTETEAKSMGYKCAGHQCELEKIEDDNYFLKVSKYTDEIREFAKKCIVPSWRGKEVLELIKHGAQDVSISRSHDKLEWGIPVPGDDSQVMYVWVDALSNYITVLGYPEKDISDCWPADLEIVGKDILRFHAIIWPAMLLALGLKLPTKLLAHGFINLSGAKISKTVGNVLYPTDIIAKYGVDAFRYFFLRHIPTFEDGEYTEEKMLATYNGELANALGNLVSRTASMITRFSSGKIKATKNFTWDLGKFDDNMSSMRFDLALEEIWKLIQHLNQYIDDKKPWELNKNQHQQKEVFEVMNYLATGLRQVAILLVPFLPETANKISSVFAGDTVGELKDVLFARK